MAHQVSERNPFLLMINPEIVLAAMAKSERLEALNRHLCRPLDGPFIGAAGASGVEADDPETPPPDPSASR